MPSVAEVVDMTWERIRERPAAGGRFNLADYDNAVREFSWDKARAELDGLPGGCGLNLSRGG
jgi:acetyl-CoA synthetase